MILPSDRTPDQRYRIYARPARSDELRIVATAPDSPSVGLALVTLWSEGEWDDSCRVGVLDTRGQDETPGEWIVSPFA